MRKARTTSKSARGFDYYESNNPHVTRKMQQDPITRCALFHNKIGYRGQRYEVRFTRDGEEHVMGWQNQAKGGLAKAAKMMPGVTKVRIVDLEKEAKRAAVRRHS